MADWRQMTLRDVCTESGGSIQTGPFGSQLHASDYVVDGTPSVMPQNIGDNRIVDDGIARVAAEDMERLEKYWLRTNDIVYSRRGDVERRALVRAENDGWLCGTGCLRVRIADQDVHDSAFVSYSLGLPASRAWITRHAVGATMLNLNTEILGRVPIRVPGLETQKAIGGVLSALDDKIAANDRVLALLDELVRARFALLDGEPRRLGDVADHVRAQVAPDSVAGDSLYLGLEHLPRRRMWVQDGGRASAVTSAKSHFRAGDVLFGKLRPYFHKVVRAPADGIASTDILVLRAKDEVLAGYVLACAASDPVVARATAASEGTRMPRTNWSQLGDVPVPWPGEEPARDFSRTVGVIADHAAQLARENHRLATTRDELLPLLMSGKVQVRNLPDGLTEEVSR